ncbi:hypothetical protein HYG89_04950 [Acinetobacter sp. SwsAc5]|uniref:hypothetical protein n=1 Tax=Acinetobacter sp. SwsAc5 TaxID=2749438 RepID=UPI0015C0C72B|nr:hypothetical protein [Acinetobacter sp. SwsAc5]NWK51914.1 hypothetical protein [Acinetobacter sp. SwsAc5]
MKIFLLPLLALGISMNALANTKHDQRHDHFSDLRKQNSDLPNFYDRKAEGWYFYQEDDQESYDYKSFPDHENKHGRGNSSKQQKLDIEKHNIKLPSGAYTTPAFIEPTDGL